MSTTSRHLCRHVMRICSQPRIKRRCQVIERHRIQQLPSRQFSISPGRRAEDSSVETSSPIPEGFSEAELQVPAQPLKPGDLDPEDRAHYETLSKSEQARYMALQNHLKAVLEGDQMSAISDGMAEKFAADMERIGPLARENFLERVSDRRTLNNSYWADGEDDDEFTQVKDDDDEWDPSMVTAIAESEMEVHREIREYTRIAAWDLPMLLQHTKPFELPDMVKSPLRFRYTTYMGETHPAENKVVVEFTTKDVASSAQLSEQQRIKLIKLVGVRYNPDKDLVKISCENFETAAQNKRYLGDLVQSIVREAKDAKDTFEDIPLDFRHHKPKKIAQFPDSWKISGQAGVQRLLQGRDQTLLLGDAQMPTKMVDGRETVAAYVAARSISPATQRAAAMTR